MSTPATVPMKGKSKSLIPTTTPKRSFTAAKLKIGYSRKTASMPENSVSDKPISSSRDTGMHILCHQGFI